MDVLDRVLTLPPIIADTLEAWWHASAGAREHDTPADRALLGGVVADRLGFAFTAGYQAALEALTRAERTRTGFTSLCVTEPGGNRPRDIATVLRAVDGERYELHGTKTWATGGPLARTLLVCATIGPRGDGRAELVLVRVAADAPGVAITPTSAPFVPEIPHARIELADVPVVAADILPGDGYADYVKPFRTVEDVHVQLALVAYLTGVTRRIEAPRDQVEELLATALALRAIAGADPRSPAVQVALAGALAGTTRLIGELEVHWRTAGGPEWQRWQRDRPLLDIAAAARTTRRQRAWARFGQTP